MSLFYDKICTISSDMELFTNSSLIGFGGSINTQWFYLAWPENIPSVDDFDLSMAFREIYPIVVGG